MNSQLLQSATAGKLTVTNELGRGGQGVVYNTSHNDYVLKVCKPEVFDTPDELKAIKQDSTKRYRTFSQLKFGADKEVSCLPLEYMQVEDSGATPAYLMRRANGQVMNRNMKTLAGLNLRDRYRIAKSLANALSLLHSRQVVHADFKPDNFFFDDKTGFVQILDIDGGGYFGSIPNTTQFYPAVIPIDVYRAPELVKRGWKTIWNKPLLRKQPDLWSLSVLIYQILVDIKGPFPTRKATEDPSYMFFRAGDYATDRPEWPRAWQKSEMEKIGLNSDIIRLFEAVFKTTKRTQIDEPKRPETILWRATLDNILASTPQPVSVAIPKPKPTPPPTPTPAPVFKPSSPIVATPPKPSIWEIIKSWFT